MSKIKLVGLDLDGTLINDKKEVSWHTREVIERATKQGVVIVPATGRPFIGIPKEVLSLPVSYAVTANGAGVYRIASRERLYENCIPWEEAYRLLTMLKEYDVMGDCFIDGYGFGEEEKLEHSCQFAMSEETRKYIKATRKTVKDLPEYVKENRCQVEKITMNFKERDGILLWEKEIREEFAKNYTGYAVVKGMPTNLEVTAGTATKGNALLHLGGLLGIKQEEIMACGDSENDLEMLKAVGVGVAMGNAVPEILEAADYVTLTNREDGVAAAIEKFAIGD